MKTTYILRVWMPDRPGALGALASRIGAVGGDVAGIDILERGAGRAIDELVVEMPSADLVDLLLAEIHQVDGVDVEDIRLAADALHDPRVDALETAAILVGAATTDEAITALCTHAVRTVGATWGAIIDLDLDELIVATGDAPPVAWISAFVGGSQSSARESTDRRVLMMLRGRRCRPPARHLCWAATVRRSVRENGGRPRRWPESSTHDFAN